MSIGLRAGVVLLGLKLAQGVGNFVEQGACSCFARACRRYDSIRAVQAQAVGAALGNLAWSADGARPFFTGMNE